jgi:hypothetical protein
MKLHLWEHIERHLHLHPPPAPQPSDEAPQEQVQVSRYRAWMSELSDDLANIDRSYKDGPPGSD